MNKIINERNVWIWTGATSVPHDTETKTDVGHCADPGCYSKTITYPNATMRQMAALADSSTECHQSIRVNTATLKCGVDIKTQFLKPKH